MEGRKRRCHVKGKKTEEDRRRGWISTLEEEDGKEQPDKFSPPFRKQFQATADIGFRSGVPRKNFAKATGGVMRNYLVSPESRVIRQLSAMNPIE